MTRSVKHSCLDAQERAQACAWAKFDFDADELIFDLLNKFKFNPYAYPGQWNMLTVQDKHTYTSCYKTKKYS